MINIRDVTAVEKAGLVPLGAALPVIISNGTAEIWGELVSDMTRGHRHDLGLNVRYVLLVMRTAFATCLSFPSRALPLRSRSQTMPTTTSTLR